MRCQGSQADMRNPGVVTVSTVGATRIMTAGMNPQDYHLQSSLWPEFNPLHFCNPVASCYAVGFGLKAKPGLFYGSRFIVGIRLGSSTSYDGENTHIISKQHFGDLEIAFSK